MLQKLLGNTARKCSRRWKNSSARRSQQPARNCADDQAPVVQRLDNFIQWIRHCPTVSICAKVSVFPRVQANMHTLIKAKFGSIRKPWTTFNMKYILDPEYFEQLGPDGSVLYGNGYESLKEFTFDSVQKR